MKSRPEYAMRVKFRATSIQPGMRRRRKRTRIETPILVLAVFVALLFTHRNAGGSLKFGGVAQARAWQREPVSQEPSRWEIGPAVPLPTEGVPQQLWASAAPDEPDRLLVCTFEADGVHAMFPSAAYVSLDAGNTWMRTLLDIHSDWVSETSCAAGTSGRDYFLAGVSDTSDGTMRHELGSVEAYRSSDGGLSWSLPRRYPFIDWMTLGVFSDRSDDVVYLFGNVQANGIGDRGGGEWNKKTRPALVSSDGLSFSDPVYPREISASDRQEGFPLSVVTCADGTALVLFAEIPQKNFVLYRYRNNAYERIAAIGMPAGVTPYGPLSAHMAIDRKGRFPGRLYAAIPAMDGGYPVLVLSSSADGGESWNAVVLLRRPTKLQSRVREYFSGGVAVDPAGDVGIEWLSSADCPEFAISSDGGQSVSERHFLGHCAATELTSEVAPGGLGAFVQAYSDRSPVDHPLKYSAAALPGFSIQIVSSTLASVQITADLAGRFHAFWSELGADGNQTFTSSVVKIGAKSSSISVSEAAELTDRSVIRVEKQAFDAYNARFGVDISVQNKGSSPIDYPALLEVPTARSDCGLIKYLNSYGTSGQGHPVFRVPAPPGKDRLFPGERSLPVHLEISVEGCEAEKGSLVSRAGSQALASRPLFPLALRFRVFSMMRNACVESCGAH